MSKHIVAEGVSFSEQLFNFVNALIHLAPSRNYVTQFLYVIKMNGEIDYRILEEAYPEILKDELTRKAFAEALGVSFEEKVSLKLNSFGWYLTEFIDRIFQLFEDPEFRTSVSALLKEEYPQGVPNLAEEWLKVRIDGLSSEPTYGDYALRVLKELVKVGRAKIEELEPRLSLSKSVLLECLNLLSLYKLVVKNSDGNYMPSDDLRKHPWILEGVGLVRS